jgi:alpha-L-rhamnosidase
MLQRVERLLTTAGRELGIGQRTPALTWSVRDAQQVKASRVQLAVDASFERVLTDTGEQPAPSGWLAWPGEPLTSRQRVHWRVQVLTEDGWTPWADSVVEAGLDAADWVAVPLGLAQDPGASAPSPSPRFSTRFTVDGEVSHARLYVTALGVADSTVNGLPVSEDVLAPGWTSYAHRLAYDTYDVTALLQRGDNELSGVVGDGWYRGGLGWAERKKRGIYGDRTAYLAQLEVTLVTGERSTVATGDGWRAETTSIRSADLYDGCAVDLTTVAEALETDVLPLAVPLVVRQGPPIRRTQVLPGTKVGGVWDFGQNLAGWVRLAVTAQEGQTVTVRHAEVLQDGVLCTMPLRSAKATDTWVLTAGTHVLEPSFTFHGFRYVEVVTDAVIESVEAVAVHSDLERTGTFACSDDRLNQLHRNVVWGQRGNFLSVPTDCPQRDERLGWTGDTQVFASTAGFLHDCRGFFGDWLADLRVEQHPDGQVPVVVPDILTKEEAGIAGWGDAAVVVPWQVAHRSGDLDLLREALPSMTTWADWVLGCLEDGLWLTEKQLGDWLDPDAPPGQAWNAKADRKLVANAVFIQTLRLLAQSLDLLGSDSTSYRQSAEQMAQKAWERWGSEAQTTQTGCALFLRSGVVPDAQRAAVGASLAALVTGNGGRIGTGFLGTPEVLFALSDTGELDAAYTLLQCDSCPSWLYQVDQGATTMWERWDGIRPDGTLNTGQGSEDDPGMLSFNHYAYGAVAAWMHEVVAGLQVSEPDATIVVAPRPGGGLTWAEASLQTPRGTASVRWDADSVTTDIPAGYTAWLDLDGTRTPLPAGRSVSSR